MSYQICGLPVYFDLEKKCYSKMTNSYDVRNYYSIFINIAATIARNFGAKIIKNVGDSLIFYSTSTVDSFNECIQQSFYIT
jgi:hypothetical protein